MILRSFYNVYEIMRNNKCILLKLLLHEYYLCIAIALTMACVKVYGTNGHIGYNSHICDTIYSYCHPNDYVTGQKIYENSKGTYSNIDSIFKNRVSLCMLSGNLKDSLIVFADLYVGDFSLKNVLQSIKRTKIPLEYDKFNASYYKDEVNTSDGPPYFYHITINNDSLCYIEDLNTINFYVFHEAIINNTTFAFCEFKVQKRIEDCSLGDLLPTEILKRLKYIKLLQKSEYKCNQLEKKGDVEFIQDIEIFIEQGTIRQIRINGY